MGTTSRRRACGRTRAGRARCCWSTRRASRGGAARPPRRGGSCRRGCRTCTSRCARGAAVRACAARRSGSSPSSSAGGGCANPARSRARAALHGPGGWALRRGKARSTLRWVECLAPPVVPGVALCCPVTPGGDLSAGFSVGQALAPREHHRHRARAERRRARGLCGRVAGGGGGAGGPQLLCPASLPGSHTHTHTRTHTHTHTYFREPFRHAVLRSVWPGGSIRSPGAPALIAPAPRRDS